MDESHYGLLIIMSKNTTLPSYCAQTKERAHSQHLFIRCDQPKFKYEHSQFSIRRKTKNCLVIAARRRHSTEHQASPYFTKGDFLRVQKKAIRPYLEFPSDSLLKNEEKVNPIANFPSSIRFRSRALPNRTILERPQPAVKQINRPWSRQSHYEDDLFFKINLC